MVKINAAHAMRIFHFDFDMLRLFLSLQLQCLVSVLMVKFMPCMQHRYFTSILTCSGCFLSLQLQCVEGNILVASGENKMEVPMLKPDEQGELAVPFIAPATPGHYERYATSLGPTCTCVIANITSNHLSI